MKKSKKILKALENLGYECSIDDDQDIKFEADIGELYIQLSKEEDYFRIVYPAFYEIENLKEKFNVLQICNEVNREIKAVKCFVEKNIVSATIESFSSNESDFEYVIKYSMKALKVGLIMFMENLEELDSPDKEDCLENVSGE